MAMKKLTFALIVLLTACGPVGPQSSKQKDVAVELRNSVWLYYVEGSQLYRALCRKDEILFNRDTCNFARRHTLLAQVYNPIKKELEDQILRKESEMAQWETKIKLIDGRILDLLSEPVFSDQAAAAALVAQIDTLQAALADIELLLTDTKNQIAMIRQQPDITADYIALLNDLVAKQGHLEASKTLKLGQISTLRNSWLNLVTDIHDRVTFDLLQNQRKQAIINWEQTSKDYTAKSTQLTEILRVFKYIADNALTYDQIPSRGLFVTRGDILARINTLFTQLTDITYTFSSHGRDSTFCVSNTICAHTFVTIGQGTKAAKISCTVDSRNAECSPYGVLTPGGVRKQFATRFIDATSESDRSLYSALWQADGAGTWRFDTTCSRAGSGDMQALIYCGIESAD